MSANVILLASHRPQPRTRETCGACSRGADGRIRECYPHRLDSLARYLRLNVVATDGELLIPRERLAQLVDEALVVIEGITDECLPERGRDVR